jgi:hypothetical protein
MKFIASAALAALLVAAPAVAVRAAANHTPRAKACRAAAVQRATAHHAPRAPPRAVAGRGR